MTGSIFWRVSDNKLLIGDLINSEDGITMLHSFVNASAEIFGHLNLALLFGLVILGGTFGARLSQILRVPQVVGCIVVGILLGHCLDLITT